MKKFDFKHLVMVTVAAVMSFSACKKQAGEGSNDSRKISIEGKLSAVSASGTSPYQVGLTQKRSNGDGTYTWVWWVRNNNPGNGQNGTFQDLSHWGFPLPPCVTPNNIVSAAVSSDGINFTPISVTYGVDKSQDCYNQPVIKFDFGTTGRQRSYYKLIVNQNYTLAYNLVGYYKSGSVTGCGLLKHCGFGCPGALCSYSQGYWFSKPQVIWGSDVTVCGFTYTQEEGKAIRETSNAGGIAHSKSGFLQVATIKLSNVDPSLPVWADVAIVEDYLSSLGKLSPSNLPTGNKAAKAAAGRIGDWIDANHCSE